MKPRYSIPLVLVGLIIIAFFFLLRHQVEAPSTVTEDLKEASFAFTPIEHASFVFSFDSVNIYNDPVGDASTYSSFAPADVILLSDIHGDHLNIDTLSKLTKESTKIVAPEAVYLELPEDLQNKTTVLGNNESVIVNKIKITAVPMYNLPESADSPHVKGRGNGYLLERHQTKVYIAGDTADIREMRDLSDIDHAFVPMNLPYTMTVEAAADAVLEFVPDTVYPYHYRGKDGLSDVERFKSIVNEQNPNIKVALLNWYPDKDTSVVEE